MSTSKRAVVSFASLRSNYIHGLARLGESLRNNFKGDFIAFVNEASCGAPLHSENPYAFKVHALKQVFMQDYTEVLWLDSSCFAVANIDPIFDHIEKHGYIMQDAGHYVGTWTNDRTLDHFKISRDEAMNMKCYGNAGFLGLSNRNGLASNFFGYWWESCHKGLFKGEWTNDNKTESKDERCLGHRHDMSCGSIIAHKLGMQLQPGDQWLQYAGPYDASINNTILIHAQGL